MSKSRTCIPLDTTLFHQGHLAAGQGSNPVAALREVATALAAAMAQASVLAELVRVRGLVSALVGKDWAAGQALG